MGGTVMHDLKKPISRQTSVLLVEGVCVINPRIKDGIELDGVVVMQNAYKYLSNVNPRYGERIIILIDNSFVLGGKTDINSG
jgi:hypothetical protein